jgi:hypothetical protein
MSCDELREETRLYPNIRLIIAGAANLLSVMLMLRLRGVGGTLLWIESNSRPFQDTANEGQLADSVADAIALVAALAPVRARCLEQALALFRYLRRSGVRCQFQLGVQPYRFRAHAWVEYDGRPVREEEENIRSLVRVPALAV